MRFRPCIDLHAGKVVQIVGGSLNDQQQDRMHTNFTSDKQPADYARLYQSASLHGGHVIALGKGNEAAALSALQAWPGGMQYGGGVTPENAHTYLDAGASHVIVTSFVFSAGRIDFDKLAALVKSVGKHRLVVDLSCRKKGQEFFVATDRWQTFTEEAVNRALLEKLSASCAEFLVHGVDVEGLRQGIQAELIELLGANSPCPVTYAGGVHLLSDLDKVNKLGAGKVDLTIGSALDIFGGDVSFTDVIRWHEQHQ